jgi:Tfp pilus assembly protein PilN
VKPIHLNLAAKPYRNYRPLYAVVVVTSLAIAFLMLNNVDTYLRYVHETKNTRAEIAKIDAEAQRERGIAAAANQQLASIDRDKLNQQSHFINTQLAERAFSWSELLDRLEALLPSDVRLTTISPAFRPDGLVDLNLQFESKSPNGMIRTLERMLADRNFSEPFPAGEQTITDGFRFSIKTQYRPSLARMAVQ